MITTEKAKELLAFAAQARENSYVPYSDFAVGAALLCSDGSVYLGCNIENASFTPTVCAERVAIFKAVSEGKRDFCAVAVVGGKKDGAGRPYCMPCGVCRQVLAEFCDREFCVAVEAEQGDLAVYTLAQLYPHGFGL